MIEQIDWTAGRFFLEAGKLLAMVAVAVYAWYRTRAVATDAAMRELGKRIDKQATRVDQLEREIERMPGWTEREKIESQLDDIRDRLSGLEATLQSTNRLLQVLHEDRLQEGRQKGGTS